MAENSDLSELKKGAAEALSGAEDPFALFARWLEEAHAHEPPEANAMALATADGSGLPNVRMVLLKDLSPEGLVFYTNSESVKGDELAGNPKAAICFHWKALGRQIRARGRVELTTPEEADHYFGTRARESRIGAWASQQSRPLPSREVLEEAVKTRESEFGDGPVPRPPHWLGYRIVPLEIEFWLSRDFRLHDRMVFRRESPQHEWKRERLYP
ncbi:Pyridoxine/pyridoxamine 5'-phosphate oxidase [Methyloligella halotolerans]|uniref:Pyridoxine/pyridoxamine 5'-phosphate oxidase n=1 Tax=Methyloligella halotolerans TaxID=1177755 RepID=A0A1E2RYL9_9HYPH|nr:pyridoxamine 5'-phosphate oxidase [Methyloligella halotolerans]ODA67323.1 Pyridoxine/pyridoxamine 5'-phosphate oxidase [Methyloligella halotolerans]